MERFGKSLVIAGVLLFVCQLLIGLTFICLMGARIIPLAPPHPALWVAMAFAAWLVAVGGGILIWLEDRRR